MNALRRLVLVGAAVLLAASQMAGCSSGMSKDQCAVADWNMIGYEDGLHGFPADRVGVHRVACAKYQVTPNLAAYTQGRERGLAEYCQPKNGFRVGLYGAGYANVCSGAVETAFVDSHRYCGDLRRAERAAQHAGATAQRARRTGSHRCSDGERHRRTGAALRRPIAAPTWRVSWCDSPRTD
jgi:hypothetical protein